MEKGDIKLPNQGYCLKRLKAIRLGKELLALDLAQREA
jgi:hypothetical protein